MFIVPVANTGYIRRRPIVTLTLIGLNTAVWLFGAVAPRPEAPILKHRRLIQELHRERGLPFETPLLFELRMARGWVVSPKSKTYRKWRDSRRRAEAAAIGMSEYMVELGGFVPEDGFDQRLLTSLFLHGDFMHLLMNMVFLFLFGCNLEDQWGRVRFTVFYLGAGVVANLAHFASAPSSDLPLVGASGAVSGVMGAFVVFYALTKIRFFWWFIIFGFFEVPAIVAIAAWFLLQVLNLTFFHLTVVAYWAHIGGFLFGLALALVVRLVRGPAPRPQGPLPERKTVALPGAELLSRDWRHRDALKEAEQSLAGGDPEKALAKFREILQQAPNQLDAQWGVVRAYHLLGRRREALALGEQLIARLTREGRTAEARAVYALLMR